MALPDSLGLAGSIMSPNIDDSDVSVKNMRVVSVLWYRFQISSSFHKHYNNWLTELTAIGEIFHRY